jgi:hypothetical protein
LLLKATRTGHEAAAEEFRVTSNKYKEQAALIRDLCRLRLEVRKHHFSISRRFLLIGVPLQICAARWERNKRENHNRNTCISAGHGRLWLE